MKQAFVTFLEKPALREKEIYDFLNKYLLACNMRRIEDIADCISDTAILDSVAAGRTVPKKAYLDIRQTMMSKVNIVTFDNIFVRLINEKEASAHGLFTFFNHNYKIRQEPCSITLRLENGEWKIAGTKVESVSGPFISVDAGKQKGA